MPKTGSRDYKFLSPGNQSRYSIAITNDHRLSDMGMLLADALELAESTGHNGWTLRVTMVVMMMIMTLSYSVKNY